MPDLRITVQQVEPAFDAVAPTLNFHLHIANGQPLDDIHAITLYCEVRIDGRQRRYTASEEHALVDLFGQRGRWGQRPRSLFWTTASIVVPPLSNDEVVVALPVPCTFDFNVAATKYFRALEGGEVPVELLFSGTVLFSHDGGPLQATHSLWHLDADYRLPVQVWQEMMDSYYPNSTWLCLRRDVADRLQQYRSRLGIDSWESALEALLDDAPRAA